MVQFTLPTSRPVTQDWAQEFYNFNGTIYPKGFYNSLGWLGHNGIDYGCYIGDPVEAVCDGIVEYVGPGNGHPLLTGGGNTVLLRNDELGIRFEFLHLSQQNVYTGQQVSRGQIIALSGDSGAATAPHLHLGAIPVGYVNQNDGWRGRVDPTPYLYGAMNPDYAGIAAQGTIQEDDMASVPQEEWEWAKQVLTALSDNAATKNDLSALPRAVVTEQFPYKHPETGLDTGETTTIATALGFADFQATQTRLNTNAKSVAANIPDGIAQEVIDALAARLGGK